MIIVVNSEANFPHQKSFMNINVVEKTVLIVQPVKVTFSSQKTLLIHYESVHIGTIYTCSQCDKAVTSLSALTRHAKTHSQNIFSCEPCSKTFSRKDKLVKHRKTMYCFQHQYKDKEKNKNIFSCTVCHKSFK